MVMTNEEICRSYRQAKDKKAQVQILADLNVCTKDEIIDALRAGGVKQQEMPRERKAVPKAVEDKKQDAESSPLLSVVTPPSSGGDESIPTKSAATSYIQRLIDERRGLCIQVLEIDKQLKALAELCSTPCRMEDLS